MREPHHYFGPTGIPRLAALWDTPFSNRGVLSYTIFTVVGGAYKSQPRQSCQGCFLLPALSAGSKSLSRGVPVLPRGVLEAALGLSARPPL